LNEIEHDVFYAKLMIINGVIRLSVPINIVKGSGYKVGDEVKIWMRKKE
jgi:hypothetical protein